MSGSLACKSDLWRGLSRELISVQNILEGIGIPLAGQDLDHVLKTGTGYCETRTLAVI